MTAAATLNTNQEVAAHRNPMTLEEFFENDLEGYEYVKGELIPMSPPSMKHGEISVNIILPLGSHVRENQLGRLYTAETTLLTCADTLTGEDVVKGFACPVEQLFQ